MKEKYPLHLRIKKGFQLSNHEYVNTLQNFCTTIHTGMYLLLTIYITGYNHTEYLKVYPCLPFMLLLLPPKGFPP